MNRLIAATCLAMGLAFPALAAPVTTLDGVVIITQAEALAGGVTAGDAPGFPISINTTGTYRLAERLSVTGATNGISVNAPNVTLDFNGFFMGGNAVGDRGIIQNQFGLTVINGTVRNFTSHGIHSVAAGLMVDNMRFADNQGYGVWMSGPAAVGGRGTVRNSILFRNALGVLCVTACLIEANVISANTSNGVYVGPSGAASILNNLISDNVTHGIIVDGGTGAGSANSIVNNGGVINILAGSFGRLGPNYCFPTPNPLPAACNP